jgi:hypothetical protein
MYQRAMAAAKPIEEKGRRLRARWMGMRIADIQRESSGLTEQGKTEYELMMQYQRNRAKFRK